jgi:hypothetical protein
MYTPLELYDVNPPRGVIVPAPTPAELDAALAALSAPSAHLKKTIPDAVADFARALETRTPPTTPAGIMVLLSCARDAHARALVTWVADADVERALLGVMLFGTVVNGRFYSFSAARIAPWRALGLWLARAHEAAYARARARAHEARAIAPDSDLRAALAALFPSEPWAREDAAQCKTSIDAMLLASATTDLAEARRLVAMVEPDDLGPAAAPLLYRFGAAMQDLLLAAVPSLLEQRFPSLAVLTALASLPTPDVAATMRGRVGKKLGGELAAQFFARFPQLATAPTANAWPAGRYVVAGRVEVRCRSVDALAEWRAKQLRKLSRKGKHPFGALALPTVKTIRAALARWEHYRDGDDWVDVAFERPSDGRATVIVRGVLGQAAIERGAEELFGLFRMADGSYVRCIGRLTMFCPASSSGFRLLATDDAIDEFVGSGDVRAIDEAPDLADEIGALVHARPPN